LIVLKFSKKAVTPRIGFQDIKAAIFPQKTFSRAQRNRTFSSSIRTRFALYSFS
jgi:hypothetical protein